MSTLVEDMFRRFMARQDKFFRRLSTAARKKFDELENKYAELTVTGEDGGVFYFLFKAGRFQLLEGPPKIPEDQIDKLILLGDAINYTSGDEVLLDVVSGDLSPRAVISYNFFRVNSDRIIYDTEEFAQAFEAFLSEMKSVIERHA
jgi:hypothetical protein